MIVSIQTPINRRYTMTRTEGRMRIYSAVYLLLCLSLGRSFTTPPLFGVVRPQQAAGSQRAAAHGRHLFFLQTNHHHQQRSTRLASTPPKPEEEEEDFDSIEVEPDDVPEDWSEEDILAEIGDDLMVVDADVETDEESIVMQTDDDNEDEIDEDDIEIDLLEDEDDDEDDFVEEDDTLEEEEEDFVVMQQDESMEDDEEEWDEDLDGASYELVDDPEDDNYNVQKELVAQAIEASDAKMRAEAFDVDDFLSNMTPEKEKILEQLPFLKAVEEKARAMMLTEEDMPADDLEARVAEMSDLMQDDPYVRHENGEINYAQVGSGITDDDLESLDRAYKDIVEVTEEDPWDKVMVKDMTGWEHVSPETIEEMEAALDELGGSAYNVTRWLLYDLDFNVTNLILSAVKHNPNAPIIFQHWYPQLVAYSRYQYARDRNFDFTWEDVQAADVSELERYYAGFGYNEIPNKAPAETGIISLEELDEEEIKMAAFENWMTEVYNSEWDRKDFDDDEMRDEDNVFSEFYDAPQHPDMPPLEDAQEDLDEWKDELLGEYGDEEEEDEAAKAYRHMMGQKFEYDVVQDEEFEREFRGHLVIACTAMDQDLEVAEKITMRFEKEFGKKVYVETRVMALAREEDNVFEIWLESYDIDLLHSKKRATSNTADWFGPAECDDAQIDYLVDRVGFLISDDARYSYRMEFEHAE